MGRHRSATASRGISRGLILTVAALVVVIAVVVAWLVLRGTTDDEGARASGTCVSGDLTVRVDAAAAIAPSIRRIADVYTDANPVVRDHCVTVDVRESAAADTIASLTADGDAGADAGRSPAAIWIPESTTAVALLRASAPDAVDGAPASIAASPVVLAATADTAREAGTPAWKDLPARQSHGGLGLAMPDGGEPAASELALAAVIANSGGDPTSAALTGADVKSPAAQSLIEGLLGAAPGNRSAAPADVLAALGAGNAAPGVRMVPTTAQQLYAANADADGTDLAALRPAGATPVADYPAVLLRPAGADRPEEADEAHAVSAAASAFINFLHGADQQRILAHNGFLIRGADASGDSAPADPTGVLTGSPPETILPGPAAEAAAAISSAVAAPPASSSPPATSAAGTTTVLLDVSGSMSAHDGGAVRLRNVAGALDQRIDALPDAAEVGLWTYSGPVAGGATYRVIVPTGPLADDVGGGTPRRKAITTGLDSAAPLGATHTYRAVQAAYSAAVDGYTDGGRNSVLLITDGPNDDQSFTDTSRLLDSISADSAPARPVSIDVIVIGPNPDSGSLHAIAEATGGSVVQVPSSTGDRFTDAVRNMLG